MPTSRLCGHTHDPLMTTTSPSSDHPLQATLSLCIMPDGFPQLLAPEEIIHARTPFSPPRCPAAIARSPARSAAGTVRDLSSSPRLSPLHDARLRCGSRTLRLVAPFPRPGRPRREQG